MLASLMLAAEKVHVKTREGETVQCANVDEQLSIGAEKHERRLSLTGNKIDMDEKNMARVCLTRQHAIQIACSFSLIKSPCIMYCS